jgi:hypothetical protein
MKPFVLISVLWLAGCTHKVGIVQKAPLDQFPPSEMVITVLRSVPGVKNVIYTSGDGRAPLDKWLGIREGTEEEYAVLFDSVTIRVYFEKRKKEPYVSIQYMSFESISAPDRMPEVKKLARSVRATLLLSFPALPPVDKWEETIYGP